MVLVLAEDKAEANSSASTTAKLMRRMCPQGRSRAEDLASDLNQHREGSPAFNFPDWDLSAFWETGVSLIEELKMQQITLGYVPSVNASLYDGGN
jgi:hypothetical protein